MLKLSINHILFRCILLVIAPVSWAHAGSSKENSSSAPKKAVCADFLTGSLSSSEDATALLKQHFNGTVPFPIGKEITISNPKDGKTMTIRILRISDLDVQLQKIMNLLKQESLANPNMLFRESGGLLFQYVNRTDSFKYFTSDLPTQIKDDVNFLAIEQEQILQTLEDHPEKVEMIVHFHTHPGFEFRKGTSIEREDIALLPNWTDLAYYEYLASLFAHHAKRSVPFSGIVLPMCEHCDDVYFEVVVKPDQKRLDEMDLRKQIDDILNSYNLKAQ